MPRLLAGITVLLSSIIAVSAFADSDPGVNDAIHAELGFIDSLYQGNVKEAGMSALNQMVAQGISDLRDNGESALANQYETEWKTTPGLGALYALGIHTFDLGDHSPLSPWLANFCDKLDRKVKVTKAIRLVKDIETLNYALPVVFSPVGKWKANDGRDYIEYRKHFIPFTTIITFWTSLEACRYAVTTHGQPGLEPLCQPAASRLEWFMGRYVAYRISDWIYAQFNQTELLPQETSINRLTVTEQDLENAVYHADAQEN